jgi:branched-chain amino acid transport system ATP-binding protein
MTDVLTLDNVTAGYGRVEVLHNLSMRVPQGAVVALLGPNGAGKTTTLNVISGTVETRRGRVLLSGRSVHRLSAYHRARRGITIVPEGRGVFPGLSVNENLDIAVHAPTNVDEKWRREQLNHVHELFPRLRERANQRAGTLSGGEQQMLAMSRALLARPKVLLLDEISMGLAPQVVQQLFGAVAQLKEQGMTIVLVEQYLTYALQLADICYVMAKGRIAFLGEPAELRGAQSLSSYASA